MIKWDKREIAEVTEAGKTGEQKMKIFTGRAVQKGIAMGRIVVWKKQNQRIEKQEIQNEEMETEKLNEALHQTKKQLQALYEKAVQETEKEEAAVFEVYQMILEDQKFQTIMFRKIQSEKVNAEYAAQAAGEELTELFARMENPYLKERKADIEDLVTRLIQNLQGERETVPSFVEPGILVAEDLSPSEVIQLDSQKVLAFVTVRGSENSHTAILARMRDIPALVSVPLNLEEIHTGMEMIVDGEDGTIILDPDEEIRRICQEKVRKEQEKRRRLQEMRGKETVTQGGKGLKLFANIGNVDDMEEALNNDAEGIGLFRSEFLYLGRREAPQEEEQFQVYREVVQRMDGKPVIIRTLDMGADKQAAYFQLKKEENPALGCRGIRFCLKRQDLFRTQLKALLRAAVFGNLSVLYPMIVSTEEVKKIDEIVKQVRSELEREGTPYSVPRQGVMIETPAAVMISEELAELTDFFSIGTNDLIQYTLAIDRQNEELNKWYGSCHKAILKMIQMVVKNAHQAGKTAGICGELGADLNLTETFLRMGVDELSVAPPMILKLRQNIRKIRL